MTPDVERARRLLREALEALEEGQSPPPPPPPPPPSQDVEVLDASRTITLEGASGVWGPKRLVRRSSDGLPRGAPLLDLVGCRDLTVVAEVVGDRPSVGPVKEGGGYVYEKEGHHGVRVRGGRNITLDVNVHNVYGDGLYLRQETMGRPGPPPEGIRVKGTSRFWEIGRQGFGIVSVKGLRVEPGVVLGNGSRTGIDFEANRVEDVLEDMVFDGMVLGPFRFRAFQYGGWQAHGVQILDCRPAGGYRLQIAYDTKTPVPLRGWVVKGNRECSIDPELLKTLVKPVIEGCAGR